MSKDVASAATSPRLSNAFSRVKGIFIIIGGVAVGFIGWFALSALAINLQKNPETMKDIAPLAVDFIQRRWLLPVLAIPVLVGGVFLAVSKTTRAASWLIFIVSMLWLLGLFGIVLFCFIAFLAPLYQYHPL